MMKSPAGPSQRLRDQRAKLLRCVRPPDRLASVQHIHSRQSDDRSGHTEQRQGKSIPNQIENHESTASPPYIPDQFDELVIAQVVHQTDAHGNVCLRKTLANGVQLENLERCRIWRLKIHANNLRAGSASNLLEKSTMAAANIEDAVNRLSVVPQGTQNRRVVPQQLMRQRKPTMHFIDSLSG